MNSLVIRSAAIPVGGESAASRTVTAERWQRALEQAPGGTIFHTTAWMQVMADTYGYLPQWFAAPGTGTGAMIPVAEVSSALTGRRGVSLPFTDFCPPLAASGETFRTRFEEILGFGRQRRWNYFELRGGREFLPEVPASTSFWGHQVPLCSEEDRMLAGFHTEVRTAIRKAEKHGVTVEFSAAAPVVWEFYGLHQQTRRRHGMPPQPYRFFENIRKHILAPGLGWVAIARLARQPVAAAIFFQYNEKAVYKFGASDPAQQQVRANNLVFWEAIKRCARAGCQVLDLGRTSLGNEGLRRFKLGWNALEGHLEYFRYDFRANRFTSAEDKSSGWHNRIFSRLPGPCSRMLGALLYRHMG